MLTWNERKAIERMYVKERKSIVYIASVLRLDPFEVMDNTLWMTRDPTPNSRLDAHNHVDERTGEEIE